jgi:hypothetical protein
VKSGHTKSCSRKCGGFGVAKFDPEERNRRRAESARKWRERQGESFRAKNAERSRRWRKERPDEWREIQRRANKKYEAKLKEQKQNG